MRFLRLIAIPALLVLAGCGTIPDRTFYIGPMHGVPSGLIAKALNTCCGSMKPAIQGGELAWVEKYSGQSGIVGYIVMTDKVTHRVIAEAGDMVILSGDNNWSTDGRVPKSDIRFIIKYIVRNEKK